MSTNCARILTVVALLACRTGLAQSEKKPTPDRKVVYKEVEGDDLELHIFEPNKAKATDGPRPAIVFFFGGGWVGGTPAQARAALNRLIEARRRSSIRNVGIWPSRGWWRSPLNIERESRTTPHRFIVCRMGSRPFAGFASTRKT